MKSGECFGITLVIFDEASEAGRPCVGAPDDPASWQEHKAALGLGQFDDLESDAVAALTVVYGAARAAPSSPAAAPVRFTVVDQGTVGKPDVILLPGLTSGRWVWEAQAAKLAPAYRLHLLQVNGFAGQPAGANATADPLLPALVEDLHTYIVTWRMRPLIVGHSRGGQWQ